MTPAHLLPAIALGLCAAATAAEPATLNCPATTTLHTAGAVPDAAASAAGLQPFVPDTPLRLTGVSVFDGPPQQGAVLQPARSSRSELLWPLSLAPGTQAWVSCDYAGGVLRLVKPMPGAQRQCSARLVQQPAPAGLAATLRCE